MFIAKYKNDIINALGVERGSERDALYRGYSAENLLVCHCCGRFLEYRNGEKRSAYFAHTDNSDRDCAYMVFSERSMELWKLKEKLMERLSSLGYDVKVDVRLTPDYWTDLVVTLPDGGKAAIDLAQTFKNTHTDTADAQKYSAYEVLYSSQGISPVIILQPKQSVAPATRQRQIDGLKRYCADRGRQAVWYDSEEGLFHICDSRTDSEFVMGMDGFDIDGKGNITGAFTDFMQREQERLENERIERERAAKEKAERDAELLRQRLDRKKVQRAEQLLAAVENEMPPVAEKPVKKPQPASSAPVPSGKAGQGRELFLSGCNAVQRALVKYHSELNDRQLEAVFAVEGPVLILAGAGSGKTKVLVSRILNMILFGNAYEECSEENLTAEELEFVSSYDGTHDEETVQRLSRIIGRGQVRPWNELAITFTNKAARELKDRLCAALGNQVGSQVNASTFHSACARILRREYDKLGFSSSFTIYDSDDSQKTIKAAIKAVGLSDRTFAPKAVLGIISSQKEQLITPEEYALEAGDDYRLKSISDIYTEYQKRLTAANAIDFDDIIMKTVQLFETYPDVLRHYQNLFRYISVDEYQDTNHAQYRLVSLLAAGTGNLCVVGDDDQSIYRFRGATIENILNFESEFADSHVIRLEQNYRSTQHILSAANSVIKNNRSRKDKALWTDAGDGERVHIYEVDDEREEAEYVADRIKKIMAEEGCSYSDFAVLYRMNAQSNAVEREFTVERIPYRVIGGMRFYDHKEVKDILAYLQVMENPYDLLRFRRIINVPKRGIGEATLASIEEICINLNMDPISVMRDADNFVPLQKKAAVLKRAAELFDSLQLLAERAEEDPAALVELIGNVIESAGYREMLEAEGDEGKARLENIEELNTSMVAYVDNAADNGDTPTLAGFLEDVALYSEADGASDDEARVNLMTLHSAKGLEFPVVFIIGMEEGIFPSSRCLDDISDMEEERRLAYVGITRAKRRLYLTHAVRRTLFGNTNFNMRSRFADEIDTEHITDENARLRQRVKEFSAPKVQGPVGLPRRSAAVSNIDYKPGMRLKHRVFGEGTVIKVTPMGNDHLLEIAFDTQGTKKVMAKFAKMTVCDT